MANLLTRIVISAKDEASAVFGSLQAKVAAVGAAIGAYFTTKLFGDAIGSARDFEAAMSAVRAAAGASGEEFAALRAAAEEAGASTKYTSIEAAAALENLAKAGLSATDAVKALPAVLDLAAAGGVGLGEASDYITKAVAGMGMSFEQAGRVADVLAMGANASNTSVQGLADALSYAAPLANSLGLNIEQTVAIIGKFADAGIDASRAGTALNGILAQFSDPASKFRQELAAAGIATGNFDQALRQLAAAGPAGSRAINAVGQEAGPALRALLNQGMGALDALKAKLDESAGSARSFAAVMSDNLDGAAKGLGSAWDALLIKLGTPVLDTLRGQINAVTERLREFVSNGTADRFGVALKSAFESAGKWAADFFSKIDFTKLAADMQAFAARAGEVFDAIGTKAAAAGNIARTAYGVMSAGINTVLMAIYGLGRGMSWLTSAFLADLALIAQGIAKVTFGDISKGFAEAAEKMRLDAQAAYAISEEFGRRAGEAFDAAAEGAAIAQAGFAGLSGSAQSSAAATTTALGAVEQQAKTTAERIAELREEQQRLTAAGDIDGATAVWREITRLSAEAAAAAKASGNVQRSEAEATAAKLAELREAYRAAVEAGDAQHAAQIQEQIRAELAKTSAQAQSTEAALEAAFQGLGIKSEAELKRLAENAKTHFTTIKNSGQATANDVKAAFKVYADAAIAANGGVATETLKAEASMIGVRLAVTESGKAVVERMTEAAQATRSVASEASGAASGFTQMAESATAAGRAMQKAFRNGPNLAGEVERLDLSGSYEAPALAILDRAERLGGLGLRKEFEERYAAEVGNKGMRVAAFGLKDYSQFFQGLNDRLDQIQIEQERETGKYAANAPRVTDTAPNTSTTVYRVEIGERGSGRKTVINTADQSSASALVSLLQQFEEAASRS